MEDKHQMHFIMIKTRGVYNQALMLRLSFGRTVSKRVCHTLMKKGPRSHYVLNTQKQSHSALFSQSYDCFFSMLNFSAICSTSTSMEDGYIYRGEEEVGIPKIVEGRPYPLGGFPIRWKQEAKGGRPCLFSRTTPYDSSTKFLWSKFHIYFLKNFHKNIGVCA